MHHPTPALTILGAGYVGEALLRRFPAADATHQTPHSDPRRHLFRLDDASTWQNPPVAERIVIWTFPAQPLEHVKAFYDSCLKEAAGLIVLGSTSAYALPPEETQPVTTVDEDTPLDMTRPRVQGEEWLRTQGATTLQLAGIFGPNRDPAGWLLRNRIKDGAKIVNLIHVDDIVALIAHLVDHPQPGKRLNVANGEPVVWRDLVARFQEEGRVPADLTLPESTSGKHGKCVDTNRLQSLLQHHRFLRP